MSYKKTSSKKNKKTYKRKSYAKKTKRVSSVKKMIRREISKVAENKSKQQFVSNYQLYATSAASFPNNVIPLGPNSTTLAIVQGTGSGNRIGNKITTKRLMIKGTLTCQPQAATTNDNPRPLMVKMIAFYDREDPNGTPVPTSTFFQDGSSSTGFTGTLLDILKPYNTDRYRMLAQRTFKLGFSQYAGTATSVVNQGINQAYSNNDFKLACNFSLNCTKMYPQTVKFNDNLSDPMTRGLYLMWYFVAADGSTLGSAYLPAQVTYMQDYVYEDA